MESYGRVKKGDVVWQIAFGSGFKCNSAVWRALKNNKKLHRAWTTESEKPLLSRSFKGIETESLLEREEGAEELADAHYGLEAMNSFRSSFRRRRQGSSEEGDALIKKSK